MKNKNLLIICPSFPDKNNNLYGGIFVKEYINSIKSYFNKIYVISPVAFGLGITKREKFCKNYNFDNIEVFYPRFFHLPMKYFREKLGFIHYEKTIKVIDKKNIKFDIIHAHFAYPSGFTGVLLKQKFNIPLITTGHGGDIYKLPYKNKKYYSLIKEVLNKSDKITTVSNSNLKHIKDILNDNNKDISVIPNGYNDKVFYNNENKIKLRNNLGIKYSKKIILTVGNLIEVKNQKTLILSCKELLKKRDDFFCYIIGDGSIKSYLQNLIDKNNLQNHVKLLGRKNHKDIAQYMNIADVFVLPSFSEGNPTVIFEALACGLPVIGSKTAGGLPEVIINSYYGLILENPNDYMDLKNLIERSFLIKYNKQKIIDYSKAFIWEIVGKKYLEIYN